MGDSSIDKIFSNLLENIEEKKLFILLLEELDIKEIFILQIKLWDFVLAEGKRSDPNFTRDTITDKMEATSDYQYRVGCTYDEAYCRAKICFFSNPNCASRKTKDVIFVLRDVLLNLRKIKER